MLARGFAVRQVEHHVELEVLDEFPQRARHHGATARPYGSEPTPMKLATALVVVSITATEPVAVHAT
jgi:hypothetical protein